MTDRAGVWMLSGAAEEAMIRELSTLSDHAAAVMAGALLDNRLKQRLRCQFFDAKIRGQTLFDRMFESTGPLATFSAKIHLGFMLGMYSEDAWRDIDRIRDIRNEFAHNLEAGSFQAQSIRDKCMALKNFEGYLIDEKDRHSKPPPHPTGSIYVDDLAERLANPRERYLIAVCVYNWEIGAPMVLAQATGTPTPLLPGQTFKISFGRKILVPRTG